MDATSIIEIALGAIVAVMGYFLKVIHSDVRNNTERVGENKGKIENLSTRIEHEAEMRNTSYTNLLAILNEIKEDIKKIKQ